MTFWQAMKATYRGSVAFLIACPLLALFPVAFELLQHGIEVHIGMYDSIAAAKATEHHPLRMAFGMVKVLSLVIPAYWITRFLAFGDPGTAARVDPLAVRLFASVVAFNAVFAAVQLFVLPPTLSVLLGGFIIGEVIACLIPAWTAAAALGNAEIGPRASIRIMARRLPWTFVFLLAAMLPPMIAHYALGFASMMMPHIWLWPILALDSLLVGWLCAVMVASSYFVAVRATELARVPLIPIRSGWDARDPR